MENTSIPLVITFESQGGGVGGGGLDVELDDSFIATTSHHSSKTNQFDVFFARGHGVDSQLGNQLYRQLIRERGCLYKNSDDKHKKQKIADEIIKIITSKGGRFLHHDAEDYSWREVPSRQLMRKVKQSLRDHSPTPIRKRRCKRKKKEPSKNNAEMIVERVPGDIDPSNQERCKYDDLMRLSIGTFTVVDIIDDGDVFMVNPPFPFPWEE